MKHSERKVDKQGLGWKQLIKNDPQFFEKNELNLNPSKGGVYIKKK